jgi:hypothetical protein
MVDSLRGAIRNDDDGDESDASSAAATPPSTPPRINPALSLQPLESPTQPLFPWSMDSPTQPQRYAPRSLQPLESPTQPLFPWSMDSPTQPQRYAPRSLQPLEWGREDAREVQRLKIWGLPGLEGVYPSGGLPPAVERQLHWLTRVCVCGGGCSGESPPRAGSRLLNASRASHTDPGGDVSRATVASLDQVGGMVQTQPNESNLSYCSMCLTVCLTPLGLHHPPGARRASPRSCAARSRRTPRLSPSPRRQRTRACVEPSPEMPVEF